MSDKETKTNVATTWINTGLLVFVLGITFTNGIKIGKLEDRSLTPEQKSKIISYVNNATFSELEAYDLVNHAKDSLHHVSDKDREFIYEGIKRHDSMFTIIIQEQWRQSRQIRALQEDVDIIKKQNK